ncbi:hypothetical protein D3C71_2082490 [compost metagenome]
MAQAEALGMMQPRLAMQMNRGISSGQSLAGCSALTVSKVSPAARYTHTNRASKNAGPRLANIRALTCATRMNPAALLPNSQP